MVILNDGDPIDATDIEPRADLSGMDLRDADLKYADLRDADLRDATLSGANLKSADLRRANIYAAKLDKVTIGTSAGKHASLSELKRQGAVREPDNE